MVIGDHGAVTCYAAACGRPVALAASASDEVIPASAPGRLLQTAPELNTIGDLREQIDDTIARFDPEMYAGVRDLTTSEPGRAGSLIRAAGYTTMDLTEPSHPVRQLPFPPTGRVPRRDAAAAVVTVETAQNKVQVRRYAAGVVMEQQPPAISKAHLVAEDNQEGIPWLETADVVLSRTPRPDGWAALTLRAFPGCAVAVALLDRQRCMATGRDGTRRLFTAATALRDPSILASVAFTHGDTEGDIDLTTPAGTVKISWQPANPPQADLRRRDDSRTIINGIASEDR